MRGFDFYLFYYEGFYRFGCIVCLSFVEWEVEFLKRKGVKDFLFIYVFLGVGEV